MAADKESKDEEADPAMSPNYKGPDEDFPFSAFRTTGYIHLTLGLMVQFLAIIQLSMGPEHRDIFLQFAAAPLWCPIPVIAVGVLGICMSRKRYWEVRCMKVCFGALSLLNAFLFMVVMGSLVGFYGFYYYSVSTYEPAEADEELKLTESTGYTVLVVLVLVIAGVEVLVSFFSFFICCCCAKVMRPNEAKKPTKTPKNIPKAEVPSTPQSSANPQSSAAPVAAHSNPMQYGIIMPPGAGAPPGAAAMVLSPGSAAGYPQGMFMIPGATAIPPGASPLAQQAQAEAPKPKGKDKKAKSTKEKDPQIKISKKKDSKKKTTATPPVNPEKAPPTFTIQVPEYMRGNPVTHGNGVPQGFISYPDTTPTGPGASVYSSASYASIPSLTTATPAPAPAPAPYAPGYGPSPAYDYYTSIPGM